MYVSRRFLLGLIKIADGLPVWSGKLKEYQRLVNLPHDLSVDRFTVQFYLGDVPEVTHFVGRQSDVSSIERALLPFDKQQRKVVVIHGLGGIGKTQLAIHYATLFREHYTTVLWFNAKRRRFSPAEFCQKR